MPLAARGGSPRVISARSALAKRDTVLSKDEEYLRRREAARIKMSNQVASRRSASLGRDDVGGHSPSLGRSRLAPDDDWRTRRAQVHSAFFAARRQAEKQEAKAAAMAFIEQPAQQKTLKKMAATKQSLRRKEAALREAMRDVELQRQWYAAQQYDFGVKNALPDAMCLVWHNTTLAWRFACQWSHEVLSLSMREQLSFHHAQPPGLQIQWVTFPKRLLFGFGDVALTSW